MRARPLILLTAIAGLAGCADNDASLEVYGLCSIPETCEFAAACDAILLDDPWVDLAVTDELQLFLEFRNQSTPNANAGTGSVNTNDARVKEVVVTYSDGLTDTGAPITVPGANIPVAGIVPAGGSSVLLTYGLVPGPRGDAARAVLATAAAMGPVRVVARIVAKGEYVNGSSFETAPFEIPIEVCNGCAEDPRHPYCSGGDTVVSVCPQYGQYGAATCEAAAP